ncbi:MAG: ribosome silencing factor [Bacteroidetes bacterium]|nr:MAG: ribosome silencing factor [Bacteroidota bacterium]
MLASFCAKITEEKLAHEVLILNLTEIEVSPSDYFVICSCDSDVQIAAVVDEIMFECRESDIKKPRVEGLKGGTWVILDFFDVVVHVMHKKARDFYKLEKLWGDAVFSKLSKSGRTITIKNDELKSLLM